MAEHYANPSCFFRDDPEDYLPPGVDRATYIDPEWNWFDKLCKRLAPHDWKLVLVTYSLVMLYLFPKMWRYYRDMEPPFNSDTDGETERVSRLRPRKRSASDETDDSDLND